MSKHEANGADAPAIESAEDEHGKLNEILRAQPLSDESTIKFVENVVSSTKIHDNHK